MLLLRELTGNPSADLRKMTFPNYRPMLDMTGRGKGICALASYSGNKVSGLILGRFENKEAEMLSVYVNPFFRKKGIASMLLKQFEKKAAAAGCSKIKAAFTSAMPSFGAVKRLFEKNGWSKPQKRMKLIYFSRENLYREIQENPRYEKYKNALLPKGFELVKWCELQPEKIAQIKSRHNQPGGWTDDNTPFREPEKMEKLNSFAILKDDSVAGWFITHRINPDTIRYTQIYNDPVANGMRGIIIQTVIHAYWLHAMYGPEKGCFIIYEWNTSLLKIFEKLMEKLTDSCTESFGVEKDIGQD